MKYQKAVSLTIGLLLFFVGICQQVYIISKQTFYPYKVLEYSESGYSGNEKNAEKFNIKMTIDSFEISSQITFKQYKLYLKSIRKDSSYNFYLSQFPDSNITSKENYSIYISNKKYENFPVAGISWEAAMNYCKWRTLQENKGTGIKFIYRLPEIIEWLAAYNFLEKNDSKHDFSKNFSDWTMSTYYEGISGFKNDSILVYDLFSDLPKTKDHPREKRKRIIGDSYFFQREELREHFRTNYTFEGYRQVSFRLIKVPLNKSNDFKSLTKRIIDYWGIGMNK